MKALRAGCIVHSEVSKYNTWLSTDFKKEILGTAGGGSGDGYETFWKFIQDQPADVIEMVYPISSEDAPGESDISVADAAKVCFMFSVYVYHLYGLMY
jgi:hypothetical protein